MSDTSILSLKNAQIFQADTLILSDVNLEINKGEFIYLIGKTGTGKSSLLKTLYGDIQLKQGSGLVANFDLATLTWKTVPMLRRNLGIIYQDFRLLTDRNVYENLEFVLKATGWKDALLIKEKIESVLAELSSYNSFIKTDEILATCRQYVAFNDFVFEEKKFEIKESPIKIIENLNIALSGKPVEDYYFILALSELLPKMKCYYNTKEQKLINFFEDRSTEEDGSIYFTDILDNSEHNLTVVLSKEKFELNNIIAKVYRTDGLIGYILK